MSAELPTGAHRGMAPEELADLIVTTVQKARGKATTVLAEVVPPHLPAVERGPWARGVTASVTLPVSHGIAPPLRHSAVPVPPVLPVPSPGGSAPADRPPTP
ncbi:hypothetical protein [Streptomyces sp. NRRL S-31]|uniref:hypothetical protein n=1 Tax=Streptomyces sp. NRRL S-31 TaxID=1463898 RepID=UPI0004C4ED12|nr:hypothetical protein [Streptomyces sp. NRRL S-31]